MRKKNCYRFLIMLCFLAYPVVLYSQSDKINWLDGIAYAIGENLKDEFVYNAWAPGCAQYDEQTGKLLFLQSHFTKHDGKAGESELWAINPYHLFDKELIASFPGEEDNTKTYNLAPFGFTIYNDRYFVVSTQFVYISEDRGKTWVTTQIEKRPSRCFGLWIFDDVMYVGCERPGDNEDYCTSTDWGKTWTGHTFGYKHETTGNSLTEPSFVKFDDRIYATARFANEKGYLLAMNNDNSWQILSNDLPNVNSTCTMASYNGKIRMAAIDRPQLKLHIFDMNVRNNQVSLDSIMQYDFSDLSMPGDFHTPTIVRGPDFQVVTFMCPVGPVEYKSCNNCAVVGYTNLQNNANLTYSIIKQDVTAGDVTELPYIGRENTNVLTGYTPGRGILNGIKRTCNSHPFENDYPVLWSPNKKWNVFGYTMWDGVEYDSKKYACYLGFKGEAKTKILAPAEKISYRYNKDWFGKLFPENGAFDNYPILSMGQYYIYGEGNIQNWIAEIQEPQTNNTGINKIMVRCGNAKIEAYNTSGIYYGVFSSLEEACQILPKGLYLIKEGPKCIKLYQNK